ncbi:MAG: hypothetical protein E7410_01490 [Ruminococcaceae bacterium]|nr:hypothetical protein [Oscillospiraceae bacterium]
MSRLDYKRKKQKEIERLERKESPFISFVRLHAGLIGLCFIVLLVITAAALIGTNPEFKDHFSNNAELYLDENTVFEMPYTQQENSVIKPMGSNTIVCAKEKIFSLSESGKTQWEIPVVLNKPLLSICGDYILACDRGGRDIYLINNGKVILQSLSSYAITNAKVASDGKFVIVSEEPYYKGLVTVRDAKNNEVFVWHSGSAYIIDAQFGANENKLALATLNTSSSSDEDVSKGLSSGMLMFNLYESAPYQTHTFDDCLITNIYKADKGFLAVTDKKTICVDEEGAIGTEFVYEDKAVNKIYKGDSLLVLCLEKDNGQKSVVALDNKAHEKCNIDVRQTPSFISAHADRIAYGTAGSIAVCDSTGKELYLIQTPKKYNSFFLLEGTKRATGVTGTAIDIIEIK